MSELLLEHNGGKRIENPDDLYSALEELLASPDKAREMGKNARTFVQANSGAVNRIMDFIGGDIASS
jgi:3-deoxy-D-manno-octulosonic-acid transferase